MSTREKRKRENATPRTARPKTTRTAPRTARPKTTRTAPGTARPKPPRTAPGTVKRQKKSDPKMLKTMYLQRVLEKINNDKKNDVNYIVYEYFRFVSATVYQRRYKQLLDTTTGGTMEDIILEDVNRFIGIFSPKRNKRNAQARELDTIKEGQPIEINFNDEQLVKFFFLMWLDSYHDETTRKSCKEYIDNLMIINQPMKTFITSKLNEVVNNLPSIEGIVPTNGGDYTATRGRFEAFLKNSLPSLFTSVDKNPLKFSTTSQIKLENQEKLMSLLVDMEVNQGLTNFSLANINKVVSKLTVAQFMDPGVYMLTGMGLNDEVKQFLDIQKLGDIDERVVHEMKEQTIINLPQIPGKLLNQYVYNNYEFHFNHNGDTFLKIRSAFNPNLNPTYYETSRAIVLEMNTTGSPQDWQPITPTKKVKVTGNFESPSNIINKFFGDCFQGMIVAGTNMIRPSSNWFLATGDGNFCAIYAHLCDTMGVPCRMLVDNATQEKPLTLYGREGVVSGISAPQGAPAISLSGTQNANTPGNINNVTSKPRTDNITNNNISKFFNKTEITTDEAKQIFKQFIVDNDDLQQVFKRIKNSNNPFVKKQVISKFSDALKALLSNPDIFMAELGNLRQLLLSYSSFIIP